MEALGLLCCNAILWIIVYVSRADFEPCKGLARSVQIEYEKELVSGRAVEAAVPHIVLPEGPVLAACSSKPPRGCSRAGHLTKHRYPGFTR